ncbi:NAD(P)H-dependent oxidoreductase [Sorangium sp. So ce315]|uniref:NAD(P)H-dependent oxidoreductase n=1 Tax=Sorangium sp. So ce315 TaxID=3133299 RepID=UPI003F606853
MVKIERMHLVIQGHPAPDSLSDALARAYASGLERGGARVEHLALRSLDFDPHLRAGFSGRQELEPDLLRAQAAIERSSHVAWFFPTWWAGPPALIKGFVDRTFLPGWSFAYRKRSPLPEGLLAGRSARVVTTMDSPSWWYRFWHRRSVHASFVNATLRFVGFGPVRETTFFGQNTRTPEQRAGWLRDIERIGERDARRSRPRSG